MFFLNPFNSLTKPSELKVSRSPLQTESSDFLWLDQCTNTQDHLWTLKQTTNSDSLPSLKGIATSHQGQGRGRQGKSWITPPHHSLALSWMPHSLYGGSLDLDSLVLFPFVGAVAVMKTLLEWGLPKTNTYIKWPNDIVITSSPHSFSSPCYLKIAGILCEGRQNQNQGTPAQGKRSAQRAPKQILLTK